MGDQTSTGTVTVMHRGWIDRRIADLEQHVEAELALDLANGWSPSCEEGPCAVCSAAIRYGIRVDDVWSDRYGSYVAFQECRPVLFAGASIPPGKGWVLTALRPSGLSVVATFRTRRRGTEEVHLDAIRWYPRTI